MDSPQQIVTRHNEFWYPNGSIVAIVENTSFRIHQSILSRHSDVLPIADLFNAVPRPDNAEQIDECPIIHLPDSLLDFEDTMKALYRPFHFDSLPANADLSTTITFISGMLRISTKYNLHLLRKKCISVLQQKFPPSRNATPFFRLDINRLNNINIPPRQSFVLSRLRVMPMSPKFSPRHFISLHILVWASSRTKSLQGPVSGQQEGVMGDAEDTHSRIPLWVYVRRLVNQIISRGPPS
ncbi:hypothetical protein BD779DRAFT_1442763 [Infundibulicybe gibba]|nr:hypothetical protein BD779DRAFT_1442763 [Infundibulicybe gibba]